MCFFPVQAESKKAAVRQVPEQIILSEVRRMVDDMKALNKKLEDTVSFLSFSFQQMLVFIPSNRN